MLCVIRDAGAYFHVYKKRFSVLTINKLQKRRSLPDILFFFVPKSRGYGLVSTAWSM